MVVAFVPMFLTTGCKKEAKTTEYEVLTDYLVDNNLDLPNMLDKWIIDASKIVNEEDGTVPGYFIVDLRKAEDFATGHIKGAVNTTLKDVLTTVKDVAKEDKILVVCYTGQTAAHATIALRLSGYSKAQVLKFGMAKWNNKFAGKWLAHSGENGNVAVGHANWTLPANITADKTYGNPDISSKQSEGAEILKERVKALLDGGFNGINNTEVLANPDKYFINNFWELEHTEHYGHIKGARRIKPLTLNNGEIKKLDPEQTVVTYCWTGQTSSMITAYLKVLGFDAKSIKFGANGMIYSKLESHKYKAPAKDYIYE